MCKFSLHTDLVLYYWHRVSVIVSIHKVKEFKKFCVSFEDYLLCVGGSVMEANSRSPVKFFGAVFDLCNGESNLPSCWKQPINNHYINTCFKI